MTHQQVTHIRTIKRTYTDAYLRLDGKRPVIHGDREASEILSAFAIVSPLELEEQVLTALELLPGHSIEPMLLSPSGAQGVEITRDHGVCLYRVEICANDRWRRLHCKKAQRAVDHDLHLARKLQAAAEAEQADVSDEIEGTGFSAADDLV